jgi:HD-GYP domain-containing protein (c-di-GMP phosphodiesterase class II)
MNYAALATVRHRVRLGEPLPFNVRDSDRTLLLARGFTLRSQAQLDTLMNRGALIDLGELLSERERAAQCPREELPRLWSQTIDKLGQTLAQAQAESFAVALEDTVAPALTLVERDPDLAIFQILSQGASVDAAYGVRRSLHSAITACLVAQRLAWQPAEVERAFKVALTMNISMLALQGELARQRTPPTPQQRVQLQSHPMRSVQMLQRAGVADNDWLQAVLQHHEVEDGSGYPSGRSDPSELASLARRADIYTSKLSARATRDALAADAAGRAIFMQDPSHPMTQALVKEFGIYPPGSLVRLGSGEAAIVVQRGPTVTTPVVACFTDAGDRPLPKPYRVATSEPGRGVVALLHPATPQPPAGVLAAALAAST